jgi:phospholipid transport system substrate-binding protein
MKLMKLLFAVCAVVGAAAAHGGSGIAAHGGSAMTAKSAAHARRHDQHQVLHHGAASGGSRARARASWDAPYAAAPPTPTPDQLVRQGVDRLVGFLIGAGKTSPHAIRTFLDHEVAPLFDFQYMANWAAGRYARRLDGEQRARLGERLRELLLNALARNLGSFTRPLPRIDVFPARAAGRPNAAIVPARVVTEAGQVVNLEFRFYNPGPGWRVYDVTANGASAVAFYRGYFNDLLRRQGPDALR